MENFQCIAIGIDRYHFLAPLRYAVADAQVFARFLVEEAKTSFRQSLLLTDTSPYLNKLSTYPNRENLLAWLEKGDTRSSSPLWFFFSGYGMNYRGEDFLLPIDGNPNDIENTGISLRSLFESLQQQTTGQICVFLDFNKLTQMRIGQQAIALAKEMKISLILSVQSMQTEQSTFSAALIEALRYYRQMITLTKLEQYLRDRLWEYNLLQGQSFQSLTVISPSPEISQQLLLNPSRTSVPVSVGSLGVKINYPRKTDLKLSDRTTIVALPKLPDLPVAPPTPTIVPSPKKRTIERQSSPVRQQVRPFKWFFSGLGFSLILSLLLTIAIYKLLQSSQPSRTAISTRSLKMAEPDTLKPIPNSLSSSSPLSPSVPHDGGNINELANASELDILNRARMVLTNNQASDFNKAIGTSRELKLNTPAYQDAQKDIERWSQIILDIAEGRARTGDFSGAIAAAQLVPRDRVILYRTAIQKIQFWENLQKQQQVNQDVIANAKKLIDPEQASSYAKAIALLRQISPSQPNYIEARQFMNNWNQKIYFLAISRAAQREIRQAIESAKLIEPDAYLYKDAQKAIAKWHLELGEKD
ncbi:MAG: peptidase C14 [Hydrococcus sp. RU_2_2]|nr:peptidase C14 [Hydrococcus sp. RU_2_2]